MEVTCLDLLTRIGLMQAIIRACNLGERFSQLKSLARVDEAELLALILEMEFIGIIRRSPAQADPMQADWFATDVGRSVDRVLASMLGPQAKPSTRLVVTVPPQLKGTIKDLGADVVFTDEYLAEMFGRAEKRVIVVSPYFDSGSLFVLSKAPVSKTHLWLLTSEIIRRDGTLDEGHVSHVRRIAQLGFERFDCRVFSKYLADRDSISLQEGGAGTNLQAFISHAKVYITDDTHLLATSANLRATSLLWNFEIGIATSDPAIIHAFLAVFRSVWDNARIPPWL